MLFDLQSAGRRRTVKTVYLGLALLMFIGFVGFSVGSSGLGGGIVDAITGSSGSSSGSSKATVERMQKAIDQAKLTTQRSPAVPGGWHNLASAHLNMSQVGDNFDPSAQNATTGSTGDYTAAGRAQINAAGTAWSKYVSLDPKQLDLSLARRMVGAYSASGRAQQAIATQQEITQAQPNAGNFSVLAQLAYQGGQSRTGDLAAAKAIALTPKKEQKALKTSLSQLKDQQQLQAAQPTPTASIGG